VARKNREKPGASPKRSPFVVVLIVAAVVGVGVVGYAVSSNVGNSQMATAPIEVPGLNNMDTLRMLAAGVTLGDSTAPIRIIEFGDYQCPSCRYFQQSVKPRIDLTYIESGQAQFVFHDFPLVQIHPYAFLAARAARCAGDQGGAARYFEYHDQLFMNQPEWASRTNLPAREFVNYAEGMGLDAAAFEACLRSDRFADVVTANQYAASQLNLPGTPAVLVQIGTAPARRVDWSTLEELFPAIVAAVDSARAGS
jgi:protein-disulfide isomerase